MTIRRRYQDLVSENRNKWIGFSFIHQNNRYNSAIHLNSGIITNIEIINRFNIKNIACVYFLNKEGELRNFCISPLSTESLLIEE